MLSEAGIGAAREGREDDRLVVVPVVRPCRPERRRSYLDGCGSAWGRSNPKPESAGPGTIAYKRNLKYAPGASPPAPEPPRPKRLTDELDDWLQDGRGGISLEEARRLAVADGIHDAVDRLADELVHALV